MPADQILLIAAALTSVAVALLHAYIIVKGAPAYRLFGAGEPLARMAERGSWLPALLTSVMALAFAVFAAYYLSAAQILPEVPHLRVGLLGVAALYTLRGMVIFPLMVVNGELSAFEQWSSLISLGIGVLHIAALWSHDVAPLSHLFIE